MNEILGNRSKDIGENFHTKTLHNNKVIPNIIESDCLSLKTECKPSVSIIIIALLSIINGCPHIHIPLVHGNVELPYY